MKIAVCFFGIPRYPQKGKVLNKSFYGGLEIDYYAHFWNNECAEEVKKLYNFKNLGICMHLNPHVYKIETKKLLADRLTLRGVKVFAKRT